MAQNGPIRPKGHTPFGLSEVIIALELKKSDCAVAGGILTV